VKKSTKRPLKDWRTRSTNSNVNAQLPLSGAVRPTSPSWYPDGNNCLPTDDIAFVSKEGHLLQRTKADTY